MFLEEALKNPIFNLIAGALVFFAQLYLRAKLDEMKKFSDKTETQIKELYERTNRIPVIEKDLENLRHDHDKNHGA